MNLIPVIFLFILVHPQDQISDITREELIDLLEGQIPLYDRLFARYKITYGSQDDQNGEFTPQEPAYEIEAEFGRELSSDSMHLYENTLTQDGDRYHNRSAFDGESGTRLHSDEPGNQPNRGTITQGPSRQLISEGARHWRPSDALFSVFDGRLLSDMLKDAVDVDIRKTTIDGSLVYVVDFATEKETLFRFDGKQALGKVKDYYRASLLPAMNMLPLSIEIRDIPGDVEAPKIPILKRNMSQFRNIGPGLWFPFAIESIHRTASSPVIIKVEVEDVTIGVEAEFDDRLTFPEGTLVSDEIANFKYTVGMSSASYNRIVEDMLNLDMMDSKIEAENLRDSNRQYDESKESEEALRKLNPGWKNSFLPRFLIAFIGFVVTISVYRAYQK